MTSPVSPTASTINLASPTASTTNLIRANPALAPKPSLWARLKAENDERKRLQSQRVTSEEARAITGYGEAKKDKKRSNAAEAALLSFDYDPNRIWGVKDMPSAEKEKKTRSMETKKIEG